MNFESYVSGYVDGEGCFCVSFQPSKRHRMGWEVRPSFSVSQNADRSDPIYRMREYFRCGSIRPDRSDKTVKYEVRSVRELLDYVIPHFRTFPMVSSKQRDVERLEKVCRLIANGDHRTRAGFEQIVEIAMEMNPSGKRKYTGSDILKSLRTGEGIVYAA